MTPVFIAIVGASGSGKSVFTQTVYNELTHSSEKPHKLVILEEDAYYRDQSHLPLKLRERINYDHPDAFEHELLVQHLKQLKSGQAIEAPAYDFNEHNRKSQTRTVASAEVIIIEGILLLADPVLRTCFDIRIFIDTPLDICLARRIIRDMDERGRSLHSVIDQYSETVRPMYYQYIEPSKQFADLIVTQGGKNRVAIEMLKQRIKSLTKL